jgi:hypothetical protein
MSLWPSGKHPIPFRPFSDLIQPFYSYENSIKDIDFGQDELRVFTASKREKVDSSEIRVKMVISEQYNTNTLVNAYVLGKSIV